MRLTSRQSNPWPRQWRPYASLLSGVCGMMNCWGLIMSYGAFFRYYDEHLLHTHASDTTIGLIGGIQAFLVLALSVVVGRLLDAHLHRYVVLVGGLLTPLGYLCLGFCAGRGGVDEGRYWLILLTQGVIAGVGMSCFFVHSSHVAIQWFPDHKFIAVGITSSGAALGGLAYPLAISHLRREYGFPSGTRIFAAIILISSLVAIVSGSGNLKSVKHPLGPVAKLSTWINWEAVSNLHFMLYTLAVCFMFFAFYPILFHITEWAEFEERGKIQVVWYLTMTNGFSFLGRIGGSALSSVSGISPLHIHAFSCFAASFVVFLCWPLAVTEASAMVFCMLFGILGGVLFGLPASGAAYLLPPHCANSLGAWTGIMWGTCSVFALAGPLATGPMVRNVGITSVGYWSGANLFVAGCLLVVVMSLKMCTNRAKKREASELRYMGIRSDV